VKIVVRLPNWLGDTVMAVPAVRALRDALPDAELLLAGPWVELLAGQGLAEVLVAYPRRWSARLRAADTVRSFGGHTVVLFPNSFEAAATAIYWGGRRRVGFAGDGRRWLLTDAPPVPEPRLHQVDEYLRLVGLLGAATTERTPRLTPPEPYADSRQRARDLLHQSGAPDGKPMVGVHLGAAFGPAKVWVSSASSSSVVWRPSRAWYRCCWALRPRPLQRSTWWSRFRSSAWSDATAPTFCRRCSPRWPCRLGRHGRRASGGGARDAGRRPLWADRSRVERAARTRGRRSPRCAVLAVLLSRVSDRAPVHARDLGRRCRQRGCRLTLGEPVPPLTILHLAANRWWTGSADPIIHLVSGLRARGHRVLLGLIPGDRFEAKAKQAGLELVAGLSMDARMGPRALARDVLRVRSLIRDERVDIVHTHHSHDHWLAVLTRPKREQGGRTPVVRTFHNLRSVRRDRLGATL
jgi:hypothetical protein